ncbi:MAG: DUF4402 domain-containing protein [Methylotenera sp.]
MNKYQMKQRCTFWLLVILFSIFASSSFAATVVKQADLAFGKLVAGSGGTVVINPNGGARSVTGGVIAVNSTFHPARFDITYSALELLLTNTTITITPTDGSASLKNGGPDMPFTNYTTYPFPLGTRLISSILIYLLGGTVQYYVGGTLTVGSGQTAGTYTETINLTATAN